MNKLLILDWLFKDTDEYAETYYDTEAIQQLDLAATLRELNNWRDISLPANLPPTPQQAIDMLRRHFKDNVTFISLVLHHYFPEQYFFYRVSALEEEIFEGLAFFKEVIPSFAPIQFPRVGRTGFERYLKLNEVMQGFARIVWLDLNNPHLRLIYFLYQGLGALFSQGSDYKQYWVMATRAEYFEALDAGEDVRWSGRKEMQPGDRVFMYRTAPRSAITDIYEVKAEPTFDPWAEWGGFIVEMKKVCALTDIPFAQMRQDPVLGQWGTVKKNFVGTVTEPVPYVVYNRLLKKIPAAICQKYELKPEPVGAAGQSGQFTSEADFETEVIVPLLRQWGVTYQPQHPCLFRVGSQYYSGRVDFYITDREGPLTLFENKVRIINDRELRSAIDQARSYALLLGLPSFIVAAPEGLWLYLLDRNKEQLVKQVRGNPTGYLVELKNLLLEQRSRVTKTI